MGRPFPRISVCLYDDYDYDDDNVENVFTLIYANHLFITEFVKLRQQRASCNARASK